MKNIALHGIAALTLALCSSACSDGDHYGGFDSTYQQVTLRKLPDPTIRRVALPRLSDAEQRRQDEVDSFILRQYEGFVILETTQTYAGDIVDWLDPDSVPGSREPPPPDEQIVPEGSSPEDEWRPLTEFDVYPEVRGPKGSVPMHRPTFEGYVNGSSGAASFEEFLAEAKLATGQPNGQTRLYGGYMFTGEPLLRAVSNMQHFAGTVAVNTFNILEVAVICGSGTTQELVGIVVGRGAAGDLGGDGSVLRIQAEFFTDGNDTIGNNQGGWHGLVTGFTPALDAPYGPGGQMTGISEPGGGQWWSPIEIRLFNGNWWLRHNGNWLGHYPGTFFNLIDDEACRVDWYGEVRDTSPASWTSTNMGTGEFAAAGNLFASFHSNTFYGKTDGTAVWPDQLGTGLTNFGSLEAGPNIADGVDAACYTTGNMTTSGTRKFYLGGPGGDATGCD
jgi:hypothetical protein